MTRTTLARPEAPGIPDAARALPLEIAVLTTEFAPLAKVGGLADVAQALACEMARLGARITVWMPAWRAVWESGAILSPLALPRPLRVPLGNTIVEVGLLEVVDPPDGVRIMLIDYAPFYWRNGIYVDPVTGEPWPDHDRRLVLFQRAVLEALPILDLRPDLFHCHDHQTGLVPVYLKSRYADDPFYQGTGTLVTIHNLGYQGLFPSEVLGMAQLPMELFYPSGPLEFWGRVNFMKGGILFADRLTTVSPRYAEEIQSSEEFGFGLEGVLRTRAADLTGILNGIDTRIWNPATDPHLIRNYDAGNLDAKRECRADLAARTGLSDLDDTTPIMGIISRLVDQKGFDLFAPQVPALIGAGYRIIVAGSGLRKYEEQMLRWRERFPGRFHWSRVIDEAMAHRITAGADFYLMPSKYEPCGLNQMISMRYGTLPIVRETGGLIDTVFPYNSATGEGTGFGFLDYTPEALLAVARLARQVFQDPDKLARLRRQAMSQDFSFGRPARAYLMLAEEIATARRGGRPLRT
ncbi:MAG: glycogen synthase [Candidatus Eisenbacteria bacterium]|nr:glycogen synthase [Candidatus Eisenbacteria bacterium]